MGVLKGVLLFECGWYDIIYCCFMSVWGKGRVKFFYQKSITFHSYQTK